MTDPLIFLSIVWAIVFIALGIYHRIKFKDKFDELDK